MQRGNFVSSRGYRIEIKYFILRVILLKCKKKEKYVDVA